MRGRKIPSPLIIAARPKTLPAAVAPVMLGSALAVQAGCFRFIPAALCLAFALLIQIGANYANDYFDFKKGADTPDRIGPPRAVASGLMTPKEMFRAMSVVFALAFLTGCGLIFYAGWWLLAVGVASILCAIAYTGGPYPLGYHGYGDLLVFIFFGLIAVMFTFFVQSGYFSVHSFWVSVVAGGLVTNILIVNNYRDAVNDGRAGKETLVVRFGRPFALVHYQFNFLVALFVPFVLWRIGMNSWVLLPLIIWPASYVLSKRLRDACYGPEYNQLLAQTAQFLIVYSILFSIGIAVS